MSLSVNLDVKTFPQFFKFSLRDFIFGDGVVKDFQFTVLPFGLSSAPYLFTKLLKPILTSWRCNGIPMAIFLDDGLGGGINTIKAKINSLTVRADLTRYGFLILRREVPLGTCSSYYLAWHCF